MRLDLDEVAAPRGEHNERPEVARFLLRALAPRDLTDEVLGDLEEVHRRRMLRHGPTRAGLVTALEALDMARASGSRRTA